MKQINEPAFKVAAGILSCHGASLYRVSAEPTADLDGKDALEITLVLSRGSANKVGGKNSLDTPMAIFVVRVKPT